MFPKKNQLAKFSRPKLRKKVVVVFLGRESSQQKGGFEPTQGFFTLFVGDQSRHRRQQASWMLSKCVSKQGPRGIGPSLRSFGRFQVPHWWYYVSKKNAYLDINPEMSVSCASLADHLWSGTWDSDGFTARSSSI